ncbi:MAG: nitric oxide reductase activation protein NorD [Gammaproteobacteria bacterium]|nr:nitric oxide reductase activation protein NorD [Gammaproteobacteria bacterium]
MTIKLEDYREQLEDADPHVRDTLEASWSDATAVMSPGGLRAYLEGARSLCGLGRGTDLVVSYLQEMPDVAREVGEEVVPDCVGEAMTMASLVSGQVIALMFSTLPVAARRLGDAQLVREYLRLLHTLAGKAPRGLRPMLEHLDMLLGKLTLGGLRRWASWGAQAHARDLDTQAEYFAAATQDSRAVLQQERRGVLFVDQHRRLNFYLRALWACDFYLRPTSGDFKTREGYRPYIEGGVIHLPDAYDDFDGIPGAELYRAAATHAAAHLQYTTVPLSPQELDATKMTFVALIEDARIEHCAMRDFPGLGALWGQFHRAGADELGPVGLMRRAARALLDEAYEDPDGDVRAIAAAFRAAVAERADDNRLSRELGLDLYRRVSRRERLPAARALEDLGVPYRDDNRFIWRYAADAAEEAVARLRAAAEGQVRRNVSVMEMVNEVDTELAGDDAQEVWILESEFYRDGDPVGVSVNQIEGKEHVAPPRHYPEWDYHIQLHRPDWTTVLERRKSKGDARLIDGALEEYRPIANRMRQVIDGLQPQGLVRLRRQEQGHDIDLDAAISAMVDLRLGHPPDPRVNLRYIRRTRDLAVLVLLDLSESTNETLPGADRPVIDLARDATALLAWAIDGIGDPFAVHGFASDGRHDVQYFRFKDFEQPYDADARRRLAGMSGGLSTRMGAALRHAARDLGGRREQRKLLLLVSDGEPADIDERDPQYLRHDTKKAVEELAARGIVTYCLTLDAHADEYVPRIFGPNGFTVVDHVRRLPERLPQVFVRLTK